MPTLGVALAGCCQHALALDLDHAGAAVAIPAGSPARANSTDAEFHDPGFFATCQIVSPTRASTC